jgi:hypothetical protein
MARSLLLLIIIMKKTILTTALVLCAITSAPAVTITSSVLNGTAVSNSTLLDFNSGNSFSNVDVTLLFSGSAGVFTGSKSGISAAPYNDSTQYLTIGSNSSITFTFANNQEYFGLLWGSVDTYNYLKFYDDDALVGSFSGSNVASPANGAQGITGTYYVNFSGNYDKVVASSTSNAFEFDNVAYKKAANVPDTTSTLGLLAVAFLGLATIARRQR